MQVLSAILSQDTYPDLADRYVQDKDEFGTVTATIKCVNIIFLVETPIRCPYADHSSSILNLRMGHMSMMKLFRFQGTMNLSLPMVCILLLYPFTQH